MTKEYSGYTQGELLDYMRSAQNGDPGAFAHINKAMYGPSIGIVRKFQCFSPDDVDDVIGDAAFSAFNKRHSFDTEGKNPSVSSWYFTIVTHTAINEYRRRKKIPTEHPINDDIETREVINGAYGIGDDALSERFHALTTDTRMDHIVYRKKIDDAIGDLNLKYQKVINFWAEGYEYTEIAGILGIPEGTVKSRLFRARADLSDSLRKKGINLSDFGANEPGDQIKLDKKRVRRIIIDDELESPQMEYTEFAAV